MKNISLTEEQVLDLQIWSWIWGAFFLLKLTHSSEVLVLTPFFRREWS